MRYLKWQIGSRLLPGAVHVPFVNDTVLVVTPGMTGATLNIYTGLHEFEDCGFLLHLLRCSDLFVDIGANVGVYTTYSLPRLSALLSRRTRTGPGHLRKAPHQPARERSGRQSATA